MTLLTKWRVGRLWNSMWGAVHSSFEPAWPCACGCVHHPSHGKGRAVLLVVTSLVWLLYGNHTAPTCYTHINPSEPYFHTACARFPLQITCVICESPFLDFSTPVWGYDWALSESGNCLKQYPFIPIFSFIYTTTENPFERDPKRYSYTQPFILGWLFFKELPISMEVTHIAGCLTRHFQ